MSYGIALSRYLVNTFNDVGCYFIAFNGISDREANRLAAYINMMNDYVAKSGLMDNNRYDRSRDEERQREWERAHSRLGREGGYYGILRGKASIGDLFTGTSGRSINQREEERHYSSEQADLDVAKMMYDYNKKKEGTGTAFDPTMLTSSPSGIVDRSMAIDGATSVAEPGMRTPETAYGEKSGMPGGNAVSTDVKSQENLDKLLDELNSLIGLDSVKENLRALINLVKVRKMREEMGLRVPEMSLHLVFSGNPGTGKTTVARLLAKIYYQIGVVSKGQMIEVDRSGLVEGYVGQTAQKTTEVCDEAMGGILFIDEAYTLTKSDGQDFGQEAVDTLLKRMEDNRADLIVIVAGYTDEMKEFIESNPGLKSRFNKFIEFPDYSSDELFEIFNLMCFNQDYVMNTEAYAYVKEHLKKMIQNAEENFANAREVRNYFERCVERQATRVVAEGVLDAEGLTSLVRKDVEE